VINDLKSDGTSKRRKSREAANTTKTYDCTDEPNEVVLKRLALQPGELWATQLVTSLFTALCLQKLEVRKTWQTCQKM